MRLLITGLIVSGLFAMQAGLAQPAVLQNGELSIAQGAVINGDDFSYYENIRLRLDPDGSLTPVSAEPRQLVSIDSVYVDVSLATTPTLVSVTVFGNLSNPCVGLLPAAQSTSGSTFHVVLAESELAPGENCAAILEPFAQTIALNIDNISPGSYDVNVNSTVASFTIEADD